MTNQTGSTNRWLKWVLFALIAVLLAFLALAYVIYLFFNPRSVVETRFQNVPPQADFICLVHDGPKGPQLMDWAISKVAYSHISPTNATMSDATDIHLYTNEVWWQPGASQRVGVLCRSTPTTWDIYWYTGSKAKPTGRTSLFGGGRASFDMSQPDQIQRLTPADQQRLGVTSLPYPFSQ